MATKLTRPCPNCGALYDSTHKLGCPSIPNGALISGTDVGGPLHRETRPSVDPIDPPHYSRFVIQPLEFITKNKLGYLEGNVIKYMCRHDAKNGAEDIRKAISFCRHILRFVYGQTE